MLCIHLHATRAGYMALSPPLHIVGYPDVIYLMADSEETVYCDRFFFPPMMTAAITEPVEYSK